MGRPDFRTHECDRRGRNLTRAAVEHKRLTNEKTGLGHFLARRPIPWLPILGAGQLLLWIAATARAVRFTPGSEFGLRPLLLLFGLLAAKFLSLPRQPRLGLEHAE